MKTSATLSVETNSKPTFFVLYRQLSLSPDKTLELRAGAL